MKLCEESSNYKVEDVELTAQSQIVSLSTCTNAVSYTHLFLKNIVNAYNKKETKLAEEEKREPELMPPIS